MLTLIATTMFGLEALAARELRGLGHHDLKVENGRVTFSGTWADLGRANLWLRTAERVLVQVGRFPARSFDELFEATRALPWEELLPADALFPVEGKSHQSQLSSVPACQAVTKKAIVAALQRRHKLERFPETGPRYRVQVALHRDEAIITLDASGLGLHKRGYRELTALAPLRETLASALVMLSGWHADRTLVDPCCGSGTLLIEAAMQARIMAPGLMRDFDASGWSQCPPAMWAELRDEARARQTPDVELRGLYGSDADGEVLTLARAATRAAGLEGLIHYEKKRLQDLQSKRKYGYLLTNPPYGVRLGEAPEVDQLYRDMGRVFAPLDTWSVFVLTAHPDFEKLFGRIAHKKRKLFNANLRTDFYQYFGPAPRAREVVPTEEA